MDSTEWKHELVRFSLLFASLLCMGTWPAVLDQYPIQHISPSDNSVRRAAYHRSICNVQLDLVTSFFLVSLMPFVIAMITAAKSTDLLSGLRSPAIVITAVAAGFLMALGQLSMQWNVPVYGPVLPVARAIQLSVAVSLATVANNQLQASMTGNIGFLMLGVVLLFVGNVAFSGTQRLVEQNESLLPGSDSHLQSGSKAGKRNNEDRQLPGTKAMEIDDTESPTEAMTTEHSEDPLVSRSLTEHKPAQKRDATIWELLTAVSSGIWLGLFPVAFNIAVNDPFEWSGSRWRTAGDALCVAQINALFAFGYWLTSFIGNLIRLHLQIGNENRLESPVSRALREFFGKESFSNSGQWAALAGMVFAFGIVLQFQGGKILGYATAELVQAWPMVYSLWTILLFPDDGTTQCFSWLAFWYFTLFLAYLAGLACFVCSRLFSELPF